MLNLEDTATLEYMLKARMTYSVPMAAFEHCPWQLLSIAHGSF